MPLPMIHGNEQTLLDNLTDMFGPFIEDISIKQDVYQAARQSTHPANSQTASMSLDLDELVAARNSNGSTVYFVATTQVPLHRPRIRLGSSIRLPWLREVRIVYRATEERPYFLHASTHELEEISKEAPASTNLSFPPTVVDFSLCRTLEVLSIEDFDKHGRPQQLRSRRRTGLPMLDPFHPEHGIKLPSCLKSLEMIGFSANRFNFGWLKETPRLERLQILGVRHIYPGTLGIQGSLWHWEEVMLPRLRYMAVHHLPAHHFRFEILYQCPRLESLDIREVHPLILCDHEATDLRRARGTRIPSSSTGRLLQTRCRLEILTVQSCPLPLTPVDLMRVLQVFLPNVTHFRVDGIPIRLLIEATSGPPTGSGRILRCGPGAQELKLVHVLTKEEVREQDVADFGLARCAIPGSSWPHGVAGRPDSIRYTIDDKEWERLYVSMKETTT